MVALGGGGGGGALFVFFFFFFQAEDGIRDDLVTGVQTCALPISVLERRRIMGFQPAGDYASKQQSHHETPR